MTNIFQKAWFYHYFYALFFIAKKCLNVHALLDGLLCCSCIARWKVVKINVALNKLTQNVQLVHIMCQKGSETTPEERKLMVRLQNP